MEECAVTADSLTDVRVMNIGAMDGYGLHFGSTTATTQRLQLPSMSSPGYGEELPPMI